MQQLLAFIILSIPANICGSISVWNRNLFFSHNFSHALLLPPAICATLGIYSDNTILLSSLLFGLVFALVFTKLETLLNSDQNFTLLVSSLIILGLTAGLSSHSQYDLTEYMFGDPMLINNTQIVLLCTIAIAYIYFIKKYYSDILLNAINKDLGAIKNQKIEKVLATNITLQCLLIVLGSRMFGSLLISSTLIAPSVLARMASNSPKKMILTGILISFWVCTIGLGIGNKLDMHPSSVITILYGIVAMVALLCKIILKKLGGSASKWQQKN